ncbi:uncharacterized protein LOC128260324 [Drosophila gunungcola]|uniref:Protein TsetseEP domain-containing protein n=1 Tax=Drosophila gunungcola TaxID=103775 RepID=A0A9P9YGH1_9MUSC|nr:uncharacterized protein LOC128260324 [Drosophila gunungcola]KAI8036158.1 hypothetical protein M5D96_011018 [Drosophila gunungcola]
MKFAAVIILTLFVASGWTQPLDLGIPAQLDAQVRSVVDEMADIGKSTGEALVHQYEEIVLEPQHELEDALDQLESRRQESPECVAAEDGEIARIVDAAHEDLHSCGMVAAHTSAEIASDVNAATQQLVFGGYSLGRTYNKCNSYKNSVLKQSCMAKFYMQTTVYLVSARSSIKTIRKSTSERIPAVFTDGNVCTHSASSQAVQGLQEISSHIDACVSRRR